MIEQIKKYLREIGQTSDNYQSTTTSQETTTLKIPKEKESSSKNDALTLVDKVEEKIFDFGRELLLENETEDYISRDNNTYDCEFTNKQFPLLSYSYYLRKSSILGREFRIKNNENHSTLTADIYKLENEPREISYLIIKNIKFNGEDTRIYSGPFDKEDMEKAHCLFKETLEHLLDNLPQQSSFSTRIKEFQQSHQPDILTNELETLLTPV